MAAKAQIEKDLGLDQPVVIQYAQWISGLFHGDLGYSYISEKPTLDEIAPRLPISNRRISPRKKSKNKMRPITSR